MLHPCVGDENPESRDRSAYADEPCGEKVEFLAYLIPAEEHHRKESRFHEKGEDAFDGERSSEDVTHEPGVVAPVGAELEFEDDTCSYADSEVDGEKLHPELGGLFPELVFFHDINSLHYGHYDGESQSERDENPMISSGESKLRP